MHCDRLRIERRLEERHTTRVTCIIRAAHQTAIGCIVDWSERGLGVVTAARIAPDTAVAVEYAGVAVVGQVRSCTPDQRAFRIGLLLESATSASVHELRSLPHRHSACCI